MGLKATFLIPHDEQSFKTNFSLGNEKRGPEWIEFIYHKLTLTVLYVINKGLAGPICQVGQINGCIKCTIVSQIFNPSTFGVMTSFDIDHQETYVTVLNMFLSKFLNISK